MATTRITLDVVRSWPATASVPDACRVIGISNRYGYELIRQHRFPCRVITIGTRRRIVTSSLIALLEHEDNGEAAAG